MGLDDVSGSPQPWSRTLVTGASSGIGEEFARQLADRGVPLVVVARRRERLDRLAADLPVDVEVLVADLATDDGRRKVEARLAQEHDPIDLLINNAGVTLLEPVVAHDRDAVERMIEINVLACATLTQAALPRMLQSDHGSVLFTSSLGGMFPMPWQAAYGATKAFVNNYAEALHEELRGSNVRVVALCPGATHTEMAAAAGKTDGGGPDWAYQSADEVAAAGLAALERRSPLAVPGIGNRIAAASARVIPRRALVRLVGKIMKGST